MGIVGRQNHQSTQPLTSICFRDRAIATLCHVVLASRSAAGRWLSCLSSADHHVVQAVKCADRLISASASALASALSSLSLGVRGWASGLVAASSQHIAPSRSSLL